MCTDILNRYKFLSYRTYPVWNVRFDDNYALDKHLLSIVTLNEKSDYKMIISLSSSNSIDTHI